MLGTTGRLSISSSRAVPVEAGHEQTRVLPVAVVLVVIEMVC
jgi:hypothetical protein